MDWPVSDAQRMDTVQPGGSQTHRERDCPSAVICESVASDRSVSGQPVESRTRREQGYPAAPRRSSLASAGRWLALSLRPARPFTALGPAWAFLAGVLAAGQLSMTAGLLLRLLLTGFLVDLLWGTLWETAIAAEWFAFLREHPLPPQAPPLRSLPYVVPGSPGARLTLWLGRVRAWWQEALWPRCSGQVAGLVVAGFLTAALALSLGRPAMLLTGAAGAILLLALLSQRRGGSTTGLQALLEIGLPWLAGHATLEPLEGSSLALAALYTLLYISMLALDAGEQENAHSAPVTDRLGATDAAGTSKTISHLWRIIGIQMVVVLFLVAGRQPLIAGLIGLLLVPQSALRAWVIQGASPRWYLRHTRVFILGGMLAAALGVR